MSVFSSIKNWFKKTFSGGGGGSSSRSSSSSRSRSSSSRASRISNYGGGGSRSYRENYSTGSTRYQSREDEERRRRQEQKEKRQATTNALASISKRTDALASGRNSSPASTATTTGSGTTRVLAKIGEKATPPDPKEQARQRVQKDATKKLKQISDDRKEMNEATGNKYNVEQKDKKKASEARRRIRSGEMISDPTVARVGFEQHPIANLAGRKIAQGASFGLADLAENKLAGDKFKESRRLYKKAEKEHPWIAAGAELAGGMVGFGLTGGATDALGARAVSKLAPNAVDDLARSRLGQRLAKSAVDKAVKKGIVSESTEELVKQVGKDRAKKIVNALGNEAVQNLTTGAVYDIANASNEYELFSDDWWKELGKSAAFNSIATTGVAGIAGLGGGRNLVRGARNFLDEQGRMRNIMMDTFSGNAERAGRNAQALAERGVKETTDALSPMNLSSKADKMSEMRKAMQDTFAQNADGARRVDMNEILAQNSPFRQADEAVQQASVDARRAVDASNESVQNEALNAVKAQNGIADTAEQTARNAEVEAPRAEAPRAEAQPRPTPPQTRATEQAPIINEGNVPRTEATEARVTPPETRANTAEPKAELPQAEAPQTEARKPKTKEEAIQMARESQTRQESEKLLRDYFNEYDEVDLGVYGQVSKNSDGTYTLSIDGAGEKKLSKAEVEERIKKSTKRAYDKPREVNDIKDVVYARNERPSFRERLKKAWGSGRTMIADSLSSFEDTERALAKAEHRQVDYGAINEVRAHQAKANRSISNRQLDYKGDKYSGTVKRVGADGKTYEIENGMSLVDIYKGMDDEVERDFDLYLTLRHAPDRLREGKPIFENTIDSKGLNFDDPKVCIAEADRLLAEHPEFAKKAEQVYQYTQNELKNRVDAGLLSKKTMDEWNEMYPHYVPTGREGFNEIHGVNGPTIGASEIRGAKGSDRNVMSIRDQLSAATTRNWRDVSTNEMFRKYFGDKIASDLAKDADGGIERVLDNTINLGKRETGNSTKYYADVYIDGKKHTVELEERFYEGLKDLYKNGRTGNALFDTTNEAFSKVAGVWKNLITEWSPIFMVKNGMRDFPEAIINSRQTKEFIQCMGAAKRDLETGGQFSEALKDAGISQSTFIDIDKALKAGKEKKSWLSRANEAIEMYPRLCEYMATLKKAGVDINDPDAIKKASRELRARAAANAADVTVNFGRSGSVGKMINKGVVPFFNPSIQGWSKFLRNVTERDLTTKEGLKDALSFIAKASALGAGANTINNFMLQDNPNYQQISARDKANNYIIPWVWGKDRTADNTDLFIKIPKSRFASAYGLPSVNAFNENDMGWAEMLRVANDQVAPIDPLESTLFSPFLAAGKNETWYGTPIVPGNLEDLPPSEQYDVNTSYIGRALGKATENLPRNMQISPKKADYLIDAEFGVAADFALPALTPSRQGGGKGVLGKAGPAILNVPKRAFTIDSTSQNDLSSRFYEKMQDATVSKNSAKATDKDAAEYKRLNAYQKEISTLTTAMRDLQGGDRATKQEDIRGLQEVRNKMMQDALDGKKPPSSAKAMDAVQKYVGTSYAIDKFGSSADKEAMKVYGASVYGNISEKEMQKKIDADKDFYKGVRAVGKMEDQLAKATGSKATSNLSKAVALASVGASDELFGAYEGTKKSRTETAIKMDRARNYISDGGSTKEFVKLEKARKTLGKLSDYDKEAELDNALAELKSGKINEAEYYQKQGEIKYNANISYVGLATSLAESNAPSRGYVLYDIKAKNVQKGINLAAMGFTARDYREMAKAVDADGNGYPKKQEIIDYVNSRTDIEDKATLYDALYYYKSSYNPFGTPTNYTREQAAENGKARGVEQISNEKGALKLKDDEESGKSGYRRYGRRRWRRWHRWGRGGHSSKAKVPAPKTIKASQFTKGEALVSKKKSSRNTTNVNPKLERVKAKIDLPTPKK